MTMADTLLLRLITLAVLLATCTAGAHEDPRFTEDRQPRYEGPGYRASQGGDIPPIYRSVGLNLRSWIPLPEFGPNVTSGNDCWGYTSPSGKEYALIGLSNGTGFVDITTPADAQIVAHRTGPTSLWRDIKVYGHHAYVVSEGGGGIQIFDMSQIDDGIVTTLPSAASGATHNVVIDEVSGFLYRTGGSGGPAGLRIYDLADPTSPAFVGQWNLRYIHDAQVVTYTGGPYADREIAFCFSESGPGGGSPGVDILDVTNKSNIIHLSLGQYSSPAFSHQGYLSPDRRYLYLNDELDEVNFGGTTQTRILDVSDLSNPIQVATFTNGNTSIDHNMYTIGDIIFAANYRSGLRVFDATDPVNLVEIGYYDTYPPDDHADFNGLWSTYPYFPSGTVIGSDLEKGLFVWTTSLPGLTFGHPDGLPELLDFEDAAVHVKLFELGDLLTPGSVRMHVDVGEGFVETLPAEVDFKLFEGVFPPLSCGQAVSYYFSAESQSGETKYDPIGAPSVAYRALAAPSKTLHTLADMETVGGWTVGSPSDTAYLGLWTRADPIGSFYQPEDDHSPDPASFAWITGQGTVGGSAGENDVDGGATTLFSPEFDLQGVRSPAIGYWRWFSTNQSEDVFLVDITGDGGKNWINIDSVGPADAFSAGGWFFHEVAIEDYFPSNSTVQLRFVASDVGQGSFVEAAIDDLTVSSLDCGCITVLFGDVFPATGDGSIDLDDVLCTLDGFSGLSNCPGADIFPCGGNGLVDLDDVLSVLAAFAGEADCPGPCVAFSRSASTPFAPNQFGNSYPHTYRETP
jgi:choice-of-anchor B domain-containing protein